MIVLDLEWNRSYDNKALEEILQIGAVKIDRLGGPVVSQFNAYIKPRIHKRFDPGAKKLPDLRESLDSELTFAEAWAAFNEWRGGETCYAFWGRDDFDTLRKNCEYWSLACEEPAEVYNLQLAFAHAYGAGSTQMALWRVVDFLGIPDVFDYHNALYDALYTALITAWLRLEDVEYKPERKKRAKPQRLKDVPFCDEAFPKQRGAKVGPYPSEERLLNARAVRLQKCPLCGSGMWVKAWYGKKQPFFSLLRCKKHGKFICRLSVIPGEGDAVFGRAALPPLTEDLKRQCEAVSVSVRTCKGQGRAKKKKVSLKNPPRVV